MSLYLRPRIKRPYNDIIMELFNNLTTEESQQLIDAVARITVLVAGADDKIDPQEIAAAEKITEVRSFSFNEELKAYYEKVGENFSSTLEAMIERLPSDLQERQKMLGEELGQLNAIFAKLDIHFSNILYQSFLSFAKHVAEASGGFIGIFSIGKEEKAVIDLPMIDPILK